jgi:hypothetical protein
MSTIRIIRGGSAVASAVLVGALWVLAPSTAQAEEDRFSQLIPGRALAEAELGSIHGKGTSLDQSLSSSGGGITIRNHKLPVINLKALTRTAPDLSGKNAARTSFGSLNLPRLSIMSEISVSVISE